MSHDHSSSHVTMGKDMAFDHTNYDDHSMTGQLARASADALLSRGVKGSLLDYGTGTGNVAILLREVASDITGVDVSEGMVGVFNKKAEDLAKDRGGPPMRAVLCPADVFKLPEQLGQKYDHAFSCLVYHHVEDPVQTTLALVRSLKPGGKVMIIDFAPMSAEKNAALLKDMGKQMPGGGHGHGHHAHSHAHGHDGEQHGHGGHATAHSHAHGSDADKPSHAEAFSHLRGYTAEQVRGWFTFPPDAGVEVSDFFYETAHSTAFSREGGEKIDFFIGGMTRV